MQHNLAKTLLSVFICLPLLATARVDQPFKISDIRVEGLQRVSAGTVFNYLPLHKGDMFNPSDSGSLIATLYASELFSDIALGRDGSTLVLLVKEFPVIDEIEFVGNKDLATKKLKEVMKSVGLAEGKALNPLILRQIENELMSQYLSRSKYRAHIETKVEYLPRNRVKLIFDISEGRSGRIQDIRLIGAKAYSEEDLLSLFRTGTTRWYSLLTKNDQYSREKLSADLDNLEAYYLNRGFMDFNITSAQVALTPDKQGVYVTINLDEGILYHVSEVNFSGDFKVDEEELRHLLTFEVPGIYSRKEVEETLQAIKNRLADEGYAFADIKVIPHRDRLTGQVALTYSIIPGNRTYVRRIEFVGNVRTQDQVLRREMRQQEGSWYSSSDMERSEERLRRLKYVASVDKEMIPVPGSSDEIDVHYKIKERSTSSITGGVGYGNSVGMMFNIGYEDNNFFSTGNTLNVDFSKSKTVDNFSISFTDPYFSKDGISASYRIYHAKRRQSKEDISDWNTDHWGALVDFGFPLSEYRSIYFGGGVRGLKVKEGMNIAEEIHQWLDENGHKFFEGVLNFSWASDSLDRAYFSKTGMMNRISAELVIPGSDISYYKLNYRNRTYLPVGESLVLSLRGDVSYGDGLKSTEDLPFYQRYYAGGLSTIRGFESNQVGPRYSNGDARGGDFRVTGGVEVSLPYRFGLQDENIRFGLFSDFGSVYETVSDFDFGDFRYSAGIFLNWLSPIGPINFSYGVPLHKKDSDKSERFQFSIGIPF